jgi:UPF0755 protein
MLSDPKLSVMPVNKKVIFRAVAIVIAFCVVVGGIYLFRSNSLRNADYPSGNPGVEIIVDIPQGATGSEIASILHTKMVVKSYAAFFSLAVTDSRAAKIAPGAHRLNQHIPARVALDQLLDSARIANLIRIPEGAWTDEILRAMEKAGFSKTALSNALRQLRRPNGMIGNEGIFFPAQYSFGAASSAFDALQSMVDRFAFEAKSAGIDQGGDGFSAMQLVTIASIVQAEGDTADFSKISQVIRNRLKGGMPLQLDTTVHYVTKTRGQVFLSTEATHTASPYNTYLHYGLPPGPIGNPGRAAMDAALHPAVGNWIYFITVKPGDTRFTDSNSQFLRWKSEYEMNLADGAFGKTS